MFSIYPEEAGSARQEAWQTELGSEKLSDNEIDTRIKTALGNAKKWVLIGGPPCQAYSTVGRSRNKGEKSYVYVPEKDNRHFLYREYLKILARHWPPVFVMENVKGILSAKVNGSRIFDHILQDLHDPLMSLRDDGKVVRSGYKYKIYSLAKPVSYPAGDFQPQFSPADFLIMSEKYGIPQSRHRVILIGIREDYDLAAPMPLSAKDDYVSASSVLDDLPRLRSGLSREEDTFECWEERSGRLWTTRYFGTTSAMGTVKKCRILLKWSFSRTITSSRSHGCGSIFRWGMPEATGKHIHVTCAIIERDGLVLAAQRSEVMSLPLKWEFPGGKSARANLRKSAL